jgi:hypothetical protein
VGGALQLVRRFRISAVFCALAVLACELISRPFADMGICDDWPYILTAQHLAATGHIVYNGWATAMLGWQLYLGAALIRLFGFSFTTVRMSTLLIAMGAAFLLQRSMVRVHISERNATIGTLALFLSPLFLMLSATFMTDIPGLFAVVICLYGCLRALQASSPRAAIGWLCFAVAANAVCGTSRQIAWLGVLVMVPSTLWMLRSQRRILLAGAAATIAGAVFIFACMFWFKHQPYSIPEHVLVKSFPLVHTFWQFTDFFLDMPFLLLPIVVLFFFGIRKSKPRVLAALFLGYLLLAVHPRHVHHIFLLEPTDGDWVDVAGTFGSLALKGTAPLFLHPAVQILLTIASFGGLLCLIALLISRRPPLGVDPPAGISWQQLGILLFPFSLAYILLLIPRAATVGIGAQSGIFDRYMPALLAVALICLVRYYQDQIQPRLPLVSVLFVGLIAVYGIVVTHNMFALYRARVAMAAEIRAAGVPDTSVDNGWEYNIGVELQQIPFINEARIVVPAHAYVPTPPPPRDYCETVWYDKTPHIHARYGISFDPSACYGPAPFAPVQYSRWLASKPGTLYVVKYTPSPADSGGALQ